jgi:hypothetical protein
LKKKGTWASFTVLLALLLSIGGTAGAALATGNTGPNQPGYWETLPGEQCVKYDNLTAKTFTVPAAEDGRDWSKAIVKAGSDQSTDGANEVVKPVEAGQVLSHSSGKNLSHVILCSVPGAPTPPTKTPVTAVNGDFTDLCGTEFNLEFRSTPTQGVAYLQHRDGNTITVTAQVTDDSKYVLTNPNWTQSATDTLTPCESELTQVTAVNGTFTDKCGTEYNLTFTPAVTEGVKYVEVREGNTLTVHAEVTDDSKYELTNPNWTQSKTDELVKCEEQPPVLKVLDEITIVPACGYVSVTNPKTNPTVEVPYGDFNQGEPDGVVTVKPGQTVKIMTTRTSLDGMVYADGYESLVFENVAVKQNCSATPPPTSHKPPVKVTPKPAPAKVTHWTPPTKQRGIGANTGIDDNASASQAFSFNSNMGIAAAVFALLLLVAEVLRKRSQPAPVTRPRHRR